MSGDIPTFGIEDGGREAPVRDGEPLRLRLPENSGTGYLWQPEFPNGLRLDRDGYEAGDAPGAVGMRVFELTPLAPGRMELRLRRVQAWEPAATPDATFRLSLDVR